MKNRIFTSLFFYGGVFAVLAQTKIIDCEQLTLKAYAPFPISIAYGAEIIKAGRDRIVLDEIDRFTTKAFYWKTILKGQNEYDFSEADAFIAYAKDKGKPIHAVSLLYHLDLVSPDFLMNFKGDNKAFEKIVKNFLQTTLKRYRGKIKSYELTNELFTVYGDKCESTWLRKRFESDEAYFDFLGRCFKYAHKADPEAILFYNEFLQESPYQDFAKNKAVLKLINRWKKNKIPIGGYGIQLHTNIYRNIKDIETTLQMGVKTGLPIQISELDVSVNWADYYETDYTGGTKNMTQITPEMAFKQKEMYKKIAEAYKRIIPKEQQYGITIWDISDADTWLIRLRTYEAPVLFDANNKKKPAYYGFLEGVSGITFDCD
jgi:endo-1,4-beta-xylanase